MLSDVQLEDLIIKPFQFLYPHYYTLHNITKVVNQDRALSNLMDHFKENTFRPKINQESVNMDL
jgi:hypothetical protein